MYNEKTVSTVTGDRKTGQLHAKKKNVIRTFWNIIHKNKLKMD